MPQQTPNVVEGLQKVNQALATVMTAPDCDEMGMQFVQTLQKAIVGFMKMKANPQAQGQPGGMGQPGMGGPPGMGGGMPGGGGPPGMGMPPGGGNPMQGGGPGGPPGVNGVTSIPGAGMPNPDELRRLVQQMTG